ncbi:pilus assembly protein TadG-related protein [Hirschia litorea]|uniref:Pilus assembly protein TadG-related protein n=1 Tax=Hirschia litorea TaxID=1199156 RepID=A0ABW2IMH9_9PROT
MGILHRALEQISNTLSSFKISNSGNVAVTSAFMILGVVAVIALAIDVSSKTSSHKELQSVTDAAALAAAREMAVSAANPNRVQSAASSYVNANWTGQTATTKASLDMTAGTITVHVSAPSSSSNLLKRDPSSSRISARAVAEVSGGGNICIVSLSNYREATIDLKDKSRLTAENCQVYSNSTHKKSVKVKDKAKINMDFVCIAGGLDGDPATLGGTVVTDCPQIGDPLRDRTPPAYDPDDCVDGKSKGILIDEDSGSRTLQPGVYCGGLKIEGAEAKLEPGVYVIKGGELKVDNGGTLIADGVGFLLAEGAKIRFKKESTIELHAPSDGPMAGLLFYEELDPKAKAEKIKEKNVTDTPEVKAEKHNIQSNDMRVMVGTVYMPYGDFLIDGDNPVSDQSEYTVIIANSFQLENGPNLVIRTDYHLSDVPLPEGVGKQDVTIRLKR